MSVADLANLAAHARQGHKPAVRARSELVISSHPVATRVGAEVLADGGTAADAALATALTQTVVEPQMSSIAGMMKLVYHDATGRETWWLSAGHRAPQHPPDLRDADAVLSGAGVAVPGWWAGFEAAHDRFGSLPRGRLTTPAIDLARHGVVVYPQLYGVMYQRAPELGASAYGRETFHRSGTLLVPGELLRQPALAETLERLTAEGSDFFYNGAFARDLCDLLGVRGGVLTPDDLAAYRVVWSQAVRGSYRGHEIATSGIPDGGLNIIEALNMVELLDLQRTGPPAQSPELLFDLMLIVQDVLERGAEQRDPHTAPDGTTALIAKEHAEARLTRLRMAGPRVGIAAPHVGTDHVTAVDRHGNVAVMMHTHTSDPWVNGLFLHGVAIPASAGWLTRTPVAPGGRITIDGAENIAFIDGRPVLAGGSPSGSLLPCVLQSMINVLDFGMDLETSAQCPRFGFSGVGSSRLVLEATIDPSVQAGLERLGMPFGLTGPFDEYMGSFDAIAWDGGELVACPDPRRTGSAEGV